MAAVPGPFGFLTRRKVLTLGGAGLGVLALGGVGLRVVLGPAPSVDGLSVLDARGYRTLDALARALFPATGAIPFGADKLELARDFDAYLAGEPAPNVDRLKLALRLLELGPVLFDKRRVGFSRLSEAERLRHFESWAASDTLLRRQIALAFRKFLALVFYDRPEVWAHIGYAGPSLARLAAK